jgi:hypothetical protein
MTEQEMLAGFKLLEEAFDKFDIKSKALLNIAYEDFKDINTYLYHNAIKNIIKTSKFTPTIAHIHEAIREIALENAETPEEVFNYLMELIRKYGNDGFLQVKDQMSKTLFETTKLTGGYSSYCMMTTYDKPHKKKEFIEIYSSLMNKEIKKDIRLLNKLYLKGSQLKIGG